MARVPFQFSLIFFLVCSLCFLEVSNAVSVGPVPPSAFPPPALPPPALPSPARPSPVLDCAALCLARCLPAPQPTKKKCAAVCQACCLLFRCVPRPSAPKDECPAYKNGKDKEGNQCP